MHNDQIKVTRRLSCKGTDGENRVIYEVQDNGTFHAILNNEVDAVMSIIALGHSRRDAQQLVRKSPIENQV